MLAAFGIFSAAPLQAQDPNMEWRLPSSGLMDGARAVIENEPCCGPSLGPAKGADSDAAVLATLPGMASRDGGVLRLKLAGDRTYRLTDCTDQPACGADDTRMHRLVAWWPQHRLYVVSVGLYEEGAAYLIAERDGQTLMTVAPPVLSPSGRQAIALVSNLMSGVDLEFLDLARDPPVLLKVTTLPTCAGVGPHSLLRPTPVWIDEQQVTFKGVSAMTDDDPNTKQLLRIVDGKPQWQC
jgi:hypothetical protein